MRGLMLAAAAALAVAAPAEAKWLQARTNHFVIDADTTETRLREFAGRLERFDAALRSIYGVGDDVGGRANRVQIYAVGRETMTALAGVNVGGQYTARAAGATIFTGAIVPPRQGDLELGSLINRKAVWDLDAQSTLFHEYTHRFMFLALPKAYPMWFTEGFAEFNGNVSFLPDDVVMVGGVPKYRLYSLTQSGYKLPITTLLEPPARMAPSTIDQIYSNGWLLTHYLIVEGHKQKQLDDYLERINGGERSIPAAKAAFGDLDALSHEMDTLLHAQQLNGIAAKVPASVSPIEIATLSPGAQAIMPYVLQSSHGVTPRTAPGVATAVAQHAAEYPDDPFVQTELAEAAYDAGRYDVADAAAGRALAADPKSVPAMLYRGRIAVRRLVAEKSGDKAAWAAARRWFVRANNLNSDAALPLLLYYRSFLAAGEPPPAVALQGLERAQKLVPDEPTMRMLLAAHMLEDGRKDDAVAMLRPAARVPDADEMVTPASKALDAIAADRKDEARTILYNAAAGDQD